MKRPGFTGLLTTFAWGVVTSVATSNACWARRVKIVALGGYLIVSASCASVRAQTTQTALVDATTLRGRVMCGYQGWFRCPGDACGLGWIHYSRDARLLSPRTLSFEMWPDVADLPVTSTYPAPGFTHADGSAARLFSSDDPAVVNAHFQQMRDYGIDGVWLQHFVVDLPGGPVQERYASRRRVLGYVADAARQTGRAWALSFDTAGAPPDKIFQLLTTEWKTLVDEKLTADDRYLHERGMPVVQVFGFYWHNAHNAMTAEVGRQLIDFFHAPGAYQAYFVGGGDWDWRRVDDAGWRSNFGQMDAYVPWNIGNVSHDQRGVSHASMDWWGEDRRTFEHDGHVWIPSIYPGFSWDNLQQMPPGSSTIPRRGGDFYWEQFMKLASMKQKTAFVAMFDEIDEGTAIFKISEPPVPGHFVGLEGKASDYYLQLTGTGSRLLHRDAAAPETETRMTKPETRMKPE